MAGVYINMACLLAFILQLCALTVLGQEFYVSMQIGWMQIVGIYGFIHILEKIQHFNLVNMINNWYILLQVITETDNTGGKNTFDLTLQ